MNQQLIDQCIAFATKLFPKTPAERVGLIGDILRPHNFTPAIVSAELRAHALKFEFLELVPLREAIERHVPVKPAPTVKLKSRIDQLREQHREAAHLPDDELVFHHFREIYVSNRPQDKLGQRLIRASVIGGVTDLLCEIGFTRDDANAVAKLVVHEEATQKTVAAA